MADFEAWARRRGLPVEPDVVDTLIEFKASYLGDPVPYRWRTGDLSELLLAVLPRKVTADEEWIAAVVPSTAALLDFLEQSARRHPSSAPIDALRAELAEITGEFEPAMHDTTRFGMAKSLFSSASAQGFDLSDPEALQQFQEAFNALPYEQRTAVTDPALLGPAEPEPTPHLPAVVLPSISELARSARIAPLGRQAVRLAEWVGSGKPVTATGVLKIAAARTAAEQLELMPAVRLGLDVDVADRMAHIRTARELPELHLAWVLAVASELLRVGKTKADRGAGWYAWTTDRDQEVLDVWASMAGVVIGCGLAVEDEYRYWFPEHEAVEREVMGALPALYQGSSTSIAQLTEDATTTSAHLRGPSAGGLLGSGVDLLLRRHIGRLVDVGVLAVDEAGAVEMSPAGRYAMNRLLVAEGVVAPMLLDPAAVDAPELLGFVGSLTPPEFDAAMAEWVAARAPQQAAGDLLAAARAGGLARMSAFAVLTGPLAEAATPLLAELVDDPDVGVYARQAMRLSGGTDHPLSATDEQWLAVDAVATMLALTAKAGTEVLPPQVWTTVEDQLGLATVWQLDHPDLLDVLDTVARHHPAGRVRKAAKKAAFKARRRLADLS